jgi:tripartite-type tricarboxylate transporter receptor subunit TctC
MIYLFLVIHAFFKTVAMPEISARIQRRRATLQVNTSEEYSSQIAKETEQWAMVIQKAKIQLE